MIFYRYYATYDVAGPSINGFSLWRAYLEVDEYEVWKETPKGYWIIPKGMTKDPDCVKLYKKFVLKVANRKFAYPDKKSAFESFKIRTKRRIEHLERQLAQTKAQQKMIEGIEDIETFDCVVVNRMIKFL